MDSLSDPPWTSGQTRQSGTGRVATDEGSIRQHGAGDRPEGPTQVCRGRNEVHEEETGRAGRGE